MKKLLFPLMAAFAIMANTVTYASEQVLTNSDAAALMAKAKEGGVSPSQISGALSKMKGYKPKDAIYIPSGGLYLFQDERFAANGSNDRWPILPYWGKPC